MAKTVDLQPYRNAPPPSPTGGNPARPSNAALMRSMDRPEYYSGGFTEWKNIPIKVSAARAMIHIALRKQASEIEAKLAGEQLHGGMADDQPASDFDTDELRAGIAVEQEHTNDESLAREIAKDHLAELPDYYTRLKKMEEKAEQEKTASTGPVHPAQQKAPAPAGAQPVAQPQASSVTGAPVDPNALFIQQLKQRIAPPKQQQAPAPAPQEEQPTEEEGPQGPPAIHPPGQSKVADAPKLIRKQHNVLFTPDGRVIVRRIPGRRFELPEGALGSPAAYESPIQFVPAEGVPEEGVHGYEIGLGTGNVDTAPEGFETVPAEDALKDLYASMGMKANKPWRDVDRQRARVLFRVLRQRAKQAPQVTPQVTPEVTPEVAAP